MTRVFSQSLASDVAPVGATTILESVSFAPEKLRLRSSEKVISISVGEVVTVESGARVAFTNSAWAKAAYALTRIAAAVMTTLAHALFIKLFFGCERTEQVHLD
jgi:hypothetical protein